MTPLKAIEQAVRQGEVGVMPTDTIYGLVGSALNNDTVKRIYRLRRRDPAKPMIILIGSVRDLAKFGVAVPVAARKVLRKAWPGPVSVVLSIAPKGSASKKFKYLHRGTGTLAFRLPKPVWLRKFLVRTGPLAAPSANFEGKPPAETIADAKKYFRDKVSFYVDIGKLEGKPSTLLQMKDGNAIVLRKGAGWKRGMV